ncbi:MAG: TRAP transporter large permease [Clostridia bacterium]|nr:TRAP transporter large permease [Clostridia bacterium]
MEPITVGIIGILAMLILIMLGMPIGFVMALVGFAGFASITSFKAALGILKMVPYETVASYTLSVVPLFVLMGNFAFYSGMSRGLFEACYRWLGRLPGGLSMATIAGCTGFAAICGSSPATAATMGTIVIPEMKKYNYDMGLATGSVAAGGTLGILIPPSVGFILYGVMTETSITKLFMAGIIPGLLLAFLFMAMVFITVKRNPEKAELGQKFTFKEKIASLKNIWPILVLFLFVIGGMYIGWFTPTEAAGVGAFGAFLFMVFSGNFSWKNLQNCLVETGRTSAMVFIIMIGAYVFGYFLAVSTIPVTLTQFITGLPVPPILIIISILLVYLGLGCIMDAIAMILLTVPIFFPVVKSLGYDPIWFGVLIVVVMEQALITPPVGVNVFVIKGIARDVPLETIFKGVLPFWIMMIIFICILLIFPEITLFLPGLMK